MESRKLTKKGKALLLALGALLIGTPFVILRGARAGAGETPPPMKMPREKFLELRNAMLEIDKIEAKANLAAQAFVNRRDGICAEFKIDPGELGKSIGVDEDGTIHRAGMDAPPALAAPPPATQATPAKTEPKAPGR